MGRDVPIGLRKKNPAPMEQCGDETNLMKKVPDSRYDKAKQLAEQFQIGVIVRGDATLCLPPQPHPNTYVQASRAVSNGAKVSRRYECGG